jgi:hypothetical protein
MMLFTLLLVLALLSGPDRLARGITSSGRVRRIFGLGERATCYLFREWAEEPLDWPRARSGTASMARFARTRRRSSTYRGTSTTKNSPFASEKFTRATPGSSLEIRVSADLASNRWTCLCVGIRLPIAWGIAADVTAIAAASGSVSKWLLGSLQPRSARQFFLSTSFCTFLPISIKRRQTFSRNEIILQLELRLATDRGEIAVAASPPRARPVPFGS